MEIPEKSVEARGISKRYKSLFGRPANILKDISLEIDAGEIFGLLGPNGSGKTTLISIFSTLIYPEEGSLFILGMDASKERDRIRKCINISTAKPNFPWSLTVQENLRHCAMLYGLYGSSLSRTVQDQMDAFELSEFKDLKFEDLSTGLKQRLSLAKAMINHPRLIFLDEPTTGLDPDISIKTRQLIRRMHQEEGISVVLSTHYMPEAEMLCDRIAFLRQGRIVALDTPHNLKRHLALGERIVISYRGHADIAALEEQPGILGLKAEEERVEIVVEKREESLDGIVKHFADARITDIVIKEPDLEEVFIELAR